MSSSLISLLVTTTIIVTTVLTIKVNSEGGLNSDFSKGLFLTPFIRKGQFEQAKEKCRVGKVGFMDFESCSGYLTVRPPPDDANLFFWFFPAVKNRANVPIILSLGGGPGVSTFQAIFSGSGPYLISSNITVVHRMDHWMNGFNVLYMDAPVGTGFSFANSTAAYSRNVTSTGKDLAEGALQFFTLFSEYATNDFYVMGESYGGRFAAVLGQRLLTTQSNRSVGSTSPFNLKGVICISAPLVYSPQYSGMVNFYHINGLITTEQYVSAEHMEDQFLDAIKTGNFQLANIDIRDFFMNSSSQFNHYISLSTGFHKILCLTKSKQEPSNKSYDILVDRPRERRALHVGTQRYHKSTDKEVKNYMDDQAVSVTAAINDVLNQGYRVLLAYGTSDMIIAPLSAQRMVGSLQWKGAAQFHTTERVIWKLEGNPEVAGYVTPAQDLWFVAIRNSGHLILADQPTAIFNIVTRFTNNNSTF